MSERILKLATAAIRPVIQQARRGRLPKTVPRLAEYRLQRERLRVEQEQQEQEMMLKVAAWLCRKIADGQIKSIAMCLVDEHGTERSAFLGGYSDDNFGAVDALARGAEQQTAAAETVE